MKIGKWNSRSVFSLLSHLSPALVCKHYYGVRGENIECWDEEKHQGDGTDIPLTVNGELFTGVMFDKVVKSVIYYRNGLIHREDGPAEKWEDGTNYWCVNGILHRIDGPAAEYSDGDKEWYVDGKIVDIMAVFGYMPSVPLSVDEQVILRLSI